LIHSDLLMDETESKTYMHNEIQRLLKLEVPERRRQQVQNILLKGSSEQYRDTLDADPENATLMKNMLAIAMGEISLYVEGWPVHLCSQFMVQSIPNLQLDEQDLAGDLTKFREMADVIIDRDNLLEEIERIGAIPESEYYETLPTSWSAAGLSDLFSDMVEDIAADLLTEKAKRYQIIIDENTSVQSAAGHAADAAAFAQIEVLWQQCSN